MIKLKESIEGKTRWEELSKSISLVEENRNHNPNIALDTAKTILESIAKTILNDVSFYYGENPKFEYLIKKAFEKLPIFSKIHSKDLESAKSIIGSFGSIAKRIGEFRNRHGFFSHGQDLQADRFDKYLVELVISSSDLIASFLIVSHSEDLKNRDRLYYEENELFNQYLDDLEEEITVSGISILPSQALFTDETAYKEAFLDFENRKSDAIKRFEKSDSFASTHSAIDELQEFKEYFIDEEILIILNASYQNNQINRIIDDDDVKDFVGSLYETNSELVKNDVAEFLNKTFGYTI